MPDGTNVVDDESAAFVVRPDIDAPLAATDGSDDGLVFDDVPFDVPCDGGWAAAADVGVDEELDDAEVLEAETEPT